MRNPIIDRMLTSEPVALTNSAITREVTRDEVDLLCGALYRELKALPTHKRYKLRILIYAFKPEESTNGEG